MGMLIDVYGQSCACTFTATGGTLASPLNWNNAATWTRTPAGCGTNTLPGPNDCVVIGNNAHVILNSGTVNVLGLTNNNRLTVSGANTRLNVGPVGAPDNKVYLISGNNSTLTVINAAIVDVWGGWASANNGNTSAVGGSAGFFNVRNCGTVGGNPNLFANRGTCDNLNNPLSNTGTLIYCLTCAACAGGSTQRQSPAPPGGQPGCAAIVTPLPITLVSFEAFVEQQEGSWEPYVALRWTTARDIDNDFFTIERSTDGENFTEIQRIPGAGNSDAVISYGTTDNAPLHGISYYRLKQTDFDGTFTYSKIVSVQVNLTLASRLSVYPNPNSGSRFFLNMKSEEVKSLAIYDLSGRLQAFCTSFELTSQGLHPVSDTQLSRGSYFVKVFFTNGQTAVRKLMVQ
ncbi:MAG: T9SS type A sorting domain-containing protein [Cytophagales bacterium]|nr:T9SS type A sorting domain-containing protein [Bernardetiaceae bacterium]MDW8205659.1 T9SS type A sorting domain-containing protein [Cytophagales bacterium]